MDFSKPDTRVLVDRCHSSGTRPGGAGEGARWVGARVGKGKEGRSNNGITYCARPRILSSPSQSLSSSRPAPPMTGDPAPCTRSKKDICPCCSSGSRRAGCSRLHAASVSPGDGPFLLRPACPRVRTYPCDTPLPSLLSRTVPG